MKKEFDNSFSIKDWKVNDRPREKMLDKGKNTLTDAELLAILIGSGSRTESAVALSTRILASVDHQLSQLSTLTFAELIRFKGIGEAKAVTIIASMELARRNRNTHNPSITVINSSKDVFNILRTALGDLDHEEFWVLYLNQANGVIQQKQISKGGKTATVVDVRIVYRFALELGATAIVVAHNHPSGATRPSTSDQVLTKKLLQAGDTLDIKVLDHVIITEKEYFSFADEAMLSS